MQSELTTIFLVRMNDIFMEIIVHQVEPSHVNNTYDAIQVGYQVSIEDLTSHNSRNLKLNKQLQGDFLRKCI